jgi:hypothetical protein
MHTITRGHRRLLDILGQLACLVAMATTEEPHECVPEDLKDLMRILQHLEASAPLYEPRGNLYSSGEDLDGCAPALIFVARHEPDLFPKTFARKIVHEKLESLRLWTIACDVDGLNVDALHMDLAADVEVGRFYLWYELNSLSLHTWTFDATELLIAPPIFGRILDAYEEQVEQKQSASMQL